MKTLSMKRPQTSISQDDPRWRALLDRDAQADGGFYYSVKTTGVYCRPSCPARRPRLENVAFHATAYRASGKDTAIKFAVGECSLGCVLVAQSERGVCAIALGDEPEALVRALQDRFSAATLMGDDQDFDKIVAQVLAFVEAPHMGLDLPLDIQGTAFQRRVWQALQSIPAGQTLSYSELAQRLGAPKSARAVAGACAANTLAVAIPCHRIVRNDGSLSGYRWGVARKQALLEREGQQQ